MFNGFTFFFGGMFGLVASIVVLYVFWVSLDRALHWMDK